MLLVSGTYYHGGIWNRTAQTKQGVQVTARAFLFPKWKFDGTRTCYTGRISIGNFKGTEAVKAQLDRQKLLLTDGAVLRLNNEQNRPDYESALLHRGLLQFADHVAGYDPAGDIFIVEPTFVPSKGFLWMSTETQPALRFTTTPGKKTGSIKAALEHGSPAAQQASPVVTPQAAPVQEQQPGVQETHQAVGKPALGAVAKAVPVPPPSMNSIPSLPVNGVAPTVVGHASGQYVQGGDKQGAGEGLCPKGGGGGGDGGPPSSDGGPGGPDGSGPGRGFGSGGGRSSNRGGRGGRGGRLPAQDPGKAYAKFKGEDVTMQDLINAIANSNGNLVIQGFAGSGKTHLVKNDFFTALTQRYGVDEATGMPKGTAITAMTGLAATHVDGICVYTYLGLGKGNNSIDEIIADMSEGMLARWGSLKCIVIDEMSMLSSELFDKLDEIAKRLRKNRRPMGGIRVIFVGDFFQLGPVNSQHVYERPAANGIRNEIRQWHRYHVFTSKAFQECHCEHYLLCGTWRHKDDAAFYKFLVQLATARYMTPEVFSALVQLQRHRSVASHNCTVKLCGTYSNIIPVNKKRMHEHVAEEYVFDAVDTVILPHLIRTQDAFDSINAEVSLRLCRGARVLLNMNLDRDLVNGTCGVVDDFLDGNSAEADLESGPFAGRQDETSVRDVWPRVHAGRSWPTVSFFDSDGNISSSQIVRPVSFEAEDHDGQLLAQRIQIPLILRYALSVHKAQGCTLDKTIVLLDDLFAYGQMYTAISRVRRSADCLVEGRIAMDSRLANPAVADYVESICWKRVRRGLPGDTVGLHGFDDGGNDPPRGDGGGGGDPPSGGDPPPPFQEDSIPPPAPEGGSPGSLVLDAEAEAPYVILAPADEHSPCILHNPTGQGGQFQLNPAGAAMSGPKVDEARVAKQPEKGALPAWLLNGSPHIGVNTHIPESNPSAKGFVVGSAWGPAVSACVRSAEANFLAHTEPHAANQASSPPIAVAGSHVEVGDFGVVDFVSTQGGSQVSIIDLICSQAGSQEEVCVLDCSQSVVDLVDNSQPFG